MVPSVESVAEVPGEPSLKQVALTIAFHDAAARSGARERSVDLSLRSLRSG